MGGDAPPNEALQVIIGSPDLKAAHSITQTIEIIQEYDKYSRLTKLLEAIMDGSKILIFCETKRGCDQLTRQMRTDGWPGMALHGDKSQQERDWVLAEFKSGRTPIMVATDVAARGLDVKDIKCVVNYDMPGTAEDYVHRIGRSGRAGAKGMAHSFFTSSNGRLARQIIAVLEEASQLVPEELRQMAAVAGGGGGGGSGFRSRGRGGGGAGFGGGKW